MTGAVIIDRLKARYRVPGATAAEQSRLVVQLARSRDHALGDALAAALARLGISADEEVCIRELRVAVRVPVRGGSICAGQRELDAIWHQAAVSAIADIVAAALERPGARGRASVVRYSSRTSAAVDFALGVASDDLGRAWAWNQMGLASLPPDPSPERALHGLLVAFQREPRTIVPALVEVARAGNLARLAARLTSAHWTALATWALAEMAGTDHLATVPTSSAGNLAMATAVRPPDGRTWISWRRRLEGSTLTRAVREQGSTLVAAVATREALATLAVLEVDPAAFRDPGTARSAVIRAAAVSALTGESAPQDVVPPGDRLEGSTLTRAVREQGSTLVAAVATREARATLAVLEVDRAAAVSALTGESAPQDVVPAGDSSSEHASDTRSPRGAGGDWSRASRTGETTQEPSGTDTDTSTEIDDHVDAQGWFCPGRSARGITEVGGLLFLLELFEDCGLLAKASADPALARRSLRWTLHRLALELTGVEPGDAAALAFAGLGPDARPPADSEDGPTAEEHAVIQTLADRLSRALSARLGPLAPEPSDAGSHVEFICRRRAEILSNPGWLEVLFPLDDVSTTIRRAGLDLDPGWVPWLGAVVKFIYA